MSRALLISENEVNLYIDEGVPWSFDLTLADADGPIDLTGHLIEMEARSAPGATPVLLRKDNSDTGGITDTGAAGVMTVAFGATDFVGATWLQAVYDIKVNGLLRPIHGAIFVSRQVTV